MVRRGDGPAGRHAHSPSPLRRRKRWPKAYKREPPRHRKKVLLRKRHAQGSAVKSGPHRYMAGSRPAQIRPGEWLWEIAQQMQARSAVCQGPLTPCVAYRRLHKGPVPPHGSCQTEVSFQVVLKEKRAGPTGETNTLNRLPKGSVGRVLRNPQQGR